MPIRVGSKIQTMVARFSHVTNRDIPVGTKGEVLGIRGQDALVKLRGFSWPIQYPINELKEQ